MNASGNFQNINIRHHLLMKETYIKCSCVSFIGLYLQLIFILYTWERNALDKFLGWLLSLLFIALNFSVQTVDSRRCRVTSGTQRKTCGFKVWTVFIFLSVLCLQLHQEREKLFVWEKLWALTQMYFSWRFHLLSVTGSKGQN